MKRRKVLKGIWGGLKGIAAVILCLWIQSALEPSAIFIYWHGGGAVGRFIAHHWIIFSLAREAKSIAERKNTLAAKLASVAELGAERMEETIGKAGLRDAAIGTGIAVDKMLALTGQMPSINIAHIALPSEQEVAERKAIHDKLSAIFRPFPELSEDGA
jgi:hypothetical protein